MKRFTRQDEEEGIDYAENADDGNGKLNLLTGRILRRD